MHPSSHNKRVSGSGRPGAATPPDVERHDEVYFRHGSGPKAGRVLSRGAHGCVIEADGERHKVRWEHLLGHKVRVRADVKVVDSGEDGFVVEASGGARRFVRDPLGVVDPGEQAAPRGMKKALSPTVLLVGEPLEMSKALARPAAAPAPTLRPFDAGIAAALETLSAAS